MNSFNTTTNEFTVPISGKYHISAFIIWNGSAAAASDVQLRVHKNGAFDTFLWRGSGHTTLNTGGSSTFNLAAGDTISISVYQNSGSSLSIQNSAGNSYFTIERVGN
jgi:hypothetical protein